MTRLFQQILQVSQPHFLFGFKLFTHLCKHLVGPFHRTRRRQQKLLQNLAHTQICLFWVVVTACLVNGGLETSVVSILVFQGKQRCPNIELFAFLMEFDTPEGLVRNGTSRRNIRQGQIKAMYGIHNSEELGFPANNHSKSPAVSGFSSAVPSASAIS